MNEMTLAVLVSAAVGIGLLHTLIGADHYVPFVVLGRARGWSLRRVLGVTAICGLGHVLASVLLGGLGLGLGAAVGEIEALDAHRGSLAAWLLIGFGLAYAAWGVRRGLRARRHEHVHAHGDGTVHRHEHGHRNEHAHAHGSPATVTFWSLFVIFVLGPCEPLVPLLMAPAALHGWVEATLVASVFGVVTIGAMVGMAALGWSGLGLLSAPRLERWSHGLAGGAIVLSGLAIQALGT